MHTAVTAADRLSCPACGASWLPTEEPTHLKTLRRPPVSRSVQLMWAALLLLGVAVWGLTALGLGRLTGWW